MRLSFRSLIGRADEEILAELLGVSAARLLSAMDPALARPSRLREMVLELHRPEVLLRRPRVRRRLLSLLRSGEAGELCQALGVPATDAFANLASVKIRKNGKAEETLFRFFGVVPPSASATTVLPDTVTLCPNYALFEHQRQAVRDARAVLVAHPHRVLLHMPTGSGKTRTALNLICDELRRSEPTLVVWLAYSEELCEQTASEFQRAWAQLGDRELNVLRYWGGHDLDLEKARDGLLVAGLGKMYSTIKSSWKAWASLADRTTLVVIDEAHQALAETYRDTLELLVGRDDTTRLLGLSATPGRTWNDIDEDARLAQLFGRRKVGLSIPGFESPVDYLVHEGYLAKVEFRSLTYGGGANVSDKDRGAIADSIDIPLSVLRKLAEDEQRNLLVIHAIEQLISRHKRIVVFGATVEHAELIAVVLRARGIDAASVTGQTPTAERERLILQFKAVSDEPKVLCNFGVLTTGFDAPRTSAAVVARPTKSLVLYSQMVGRAMRGPQAGGNQHAEVVTVVDSALPGFGDVAEAFHNWEDVWNDG